MKNIPPLTVEEQLNDLRRGVEVAHKLGADAAQLRRSVKAHGQSILANVAACLPLSDFLCQDYRSAVVDLRHNRQDRDNLRNAQERRFRILGRTVYRQATGK